MNRFAEIAEKLPAGDTAVFIIAPAAGAVNTAPGVLKRGEEKSA